MGLTTVTINILQREFLLSRFLLIQVQPPGKRRVLHFRASTRSVSAQQQYEEDHATPAPCEYFALLASLFGHQFLCRRQPAVAE